MRAYYVATPRSQWYDMPTLCCTDRIGVGQVALVQVHPTAHARKHMVWHRRCVEALLAAAPCDDDDPVVEAFLKKLLKPGPKEADAARGG